MQKFKKMLLPVLCACATLSAPMAVLAEGESEATTNINITTETATIDIVVPGSIEEAEAGGGTAADAKGLSFIFKADGTNTVPTNWTITNKSAVDIQLDSITVTGENGWSLVASGDSSLATTNAKSVYMTLGGVDADASGKYTLNKKIDKKVGDTNGELNVAIGVGNAGVGRANFSQVISAQKAFKTVMKFSYAD